MKLIIQAVSCWGGVGGWAPFCYF